MVGAGILCVLALLQSTPATPGASVGMPVTMKELVLPGSELEIVPADDTTALILRLDAVRPHGTGFRYDLVWYGLEPGDYDLGRFLRRKDGSSTADLPPLLVVVRSLLPPGQIEPHRPAPLEQVHLGGYLWSLGALGAVWLATLAWLLRTRRRARSKEAAVELRARTSAERLAELVEVAIADGLTPEGRAELELVLIASWRARLALEDAQPEELLLVLKAHPEAGPELRGLEDWLHRPGAGEVDLARLFEAYRAPASRPVSVSEAR